MRIKEKKNTGIEIAIWAMAFAINWKVALVFLCVVLVLYKEIND
jgi:hypothetical protein